MTYKPLSQEMNHDCSEPNIAPPFVWTSDWPRSWLVTQIWLAKLEKSVVGRMKNILRKTSSQIKKKKKKVDMQEETVFLLPSYF